MPGNFTQNTDLTNNVAGVETTQLVFRMLAFTADDSKRFQVELNKLGRQPDSPCG